MTRAEEGDATPFDPASVEELPGAARRYLLWAVAPGTPRARVMALEMHGTIRLSRDRPPLPMTATQLLAPPTEFTWRARTHGGLMRIRGFDRYSAGAGEMRWRLFGVIPVMRASGPDVTRSAAGRLAMESVLAPWALLPGTGVHWEAAGGPEHQQALFRMQVGGEMVSTTLTVADDGRPLRVSASRWKEDAGPEGPGYLRFDVELEGSIQAGGYRIPRRIVAGWRLGEADGFPFFESTLDRAVALVDHPEMMGPR